MKMSDQPSVTVETTIAAAAHKIFDLIRDLDVMSSFETEFQGGEWAAGRPGALGSKFTGRQKLGEYEWETTATIVELVDDRSFAWVVGDPQAPSATWTFQLRSVPDGTELRYTFLHGPAGSGLTSIIAKQPENEAELIDARLATLQDNMVKTLEGIRRRLDA